MATFNTFYNTLDIQDKIRGSLMAGAAGDALGYTVEFMSRNAIIKRYGKDGITSFELEGDLARVSDDTQMTLFTANSMLMGITRGMMRGVGGLPENYVELGYLDWYYTQTGIGSSGPHTWLRDLPRMAHRRAPGNTCLSACEALLNQREVSNNSKGCGGIMRVAPMGLLMAGYNVRGEEPYDEARTAWAGGEMARCTHKHPLGFLPAAALTNLVHNLAKLPTQEGINKFHFIARNATHILNDIYKGEFEHDKKIMQDLTMRALELAEGHLDDAAAIALLGEGWTGEEAWAIAVYCAARHIDDPARAIIAAVNHDGDSDSTGSVTGNIVGAIYGYRFLEEHHLFCPRHRSLASTLELSDIILTLADDLTTSCIIGEWSYLDTPEKSQWFERYCEMKPAGLPKYRYTRAFTPDAIRHLNTNEIFVFGSNLAGMHGGGAAAAAHRHFGAVWGQGVGLAGQSYAIPTMQGGVETIKPYVDEFLRFACTHRDLTFYVTRIGCGIAGFTDRQIAPLFRAALPFHNVILPHSFVSLLTSTQ